MTQPESKVSQSQGGLRNLKLNESAKRTLSLAVATAGATAFNLVLGLVTARILGPSGRGVVAVAITIGATTSLLFSLGTNTAARYYLPRRDGEVTMGDYQAFIAVMAIVSMGISLLIAWAITESNPTYGGWPTIWLSAVVSALTFLAYMESDALNAFGVLRGSALLSGASSAVEVVLVLVLAVFHQVTTRSVLGVLVIGMFLQICSILTVLARTHRLRALRLRRRSLALMFRKGLPSLGTNAGQSFTFRLDRYIVAGVLGPAPLGVYSVAVAGSEVLRMLPAAWGQTAFYQVASGARTVSSLRHERRLILTLMVPALIIWGLVAPYLVRLTVGGAYSGAVTPWRILLLGEIGVMAYQVDSCLLSSTGKTAAAGLGGAVGLVIVAILDVLWIPLWGLIGAAEASAIAYLAMGVVAALALHKDELENQPSPTVPVRVPGGNPARLTT
jgi:O-antigen/teichoic acid export membrane protein